MEAKISELKCPGCGANVSINQKTCEYCRKPLIISTMSDALLTKEAAQKYSKSYKDYESHAANKGELSKPLGICYLKLRLFDNAIKCFRQAIDLEPDDSENYFYLSIALLKGKKPFLHNREEIDEIVSYLNAAANLESNGLYYYFLAYVQYDYFERKRFRVSPNYVDSLTQVKMYGASAFDVNNLFQILQAAIPNDSLFNEALL